MRPSTRVVFIVLAAVTSVQTLWWAYLLIKAAPEHQVMALAEGTFFLLVLFLGIFIAYRSLKQEISIKAAQSDFLSAVTHELKTPLANIRLCLDTLERQNLNEEDRRKYLLRAQNAVDHLNREIEGVLTIAAQEPSKAAATKFDLNDLFEDCISLLDQAGERDRVHFQRQSPVWVWAPYAEGRLIIRNLLDNALKYSKPDQKVEVKISGEGPCAHAHISDQGIGFQEGEIDRAFQPFVRLPRALKHQPTGTGIGLALVQRLSRSAGVEVELKSPGPDMGTQAIIRWPKYEGANG